ncbi:MAG TPA: biliverdin-producing heme oxygenase, partial [Cytophagales bacterium]|nr:biliverdin-producing heme oxygenase [Cytophagales bacterium]
TAPLHASLEDTELLSYFKNKNITLEVYKTILDRFYSFHAPLEQQLHSYFGDQVSVVDYLERRKSEALLSDLHYLKASYGYVLHLEPSPYLPIVQSMSHAFGCLYVLEGSTLGGQIISRVLKDNLGLGPENGASYFNGYGSSTGEKWKMFCAAITQYSAMAGQDDRIVAAANDTFIKLKMTLQ